jgi:murein DD-endopeptidase MepM/ murein hydrolase activator NlpD
MMYAGCDVPGEFRVLLKAGRTAEDRSSGGFIKKEGNGMNSPKNGRSCAFPGTAILILIAVAIPVFPVVAGRQILANSAAANIEEPGVNASPPTLEPISLLEYPTESNDRPPPYKAPLQLRPEDHYWFDRPIPSTYVNWIDHEYPYGGDYYNEFEPHSGVDFPAKAKTPVVAAADGVVNWTGVGLFGHYENPSDPYGLAVTIRHDFGYRGQAVYSVYAHLSQIDVKPGQRVKAGDPIGLVGATGKVTGPHLHFEVRIGEDSFYTTRNPELWLVPPVGYGVLAGRIETVDSWPLVEYPFKLRRADKKYDTTYYTYVGNITNPDDLYEENLVVGDLPAGPYVVDTWVWWKHYVFTVNVAPGQTTFVVIHSGLDPLINPPMA